MQSEQFENKEASKQEFILHFKMKLVALLFLGGLYSLYYFVYEKPQYTRRVQIVETSQPLHDYKIVQYRRSSSHDVVSIEWQGKTFEDVWVNSISYKLREDNDSLFSYLESLHYYYDKNNDELFSEERVIDPVIDDPSFDLYVIWGVITLALINSYIRMVRQMRKAGL